MSAGMGRGGAEREIVFVSILFPQSGCVCVGVCVKGGSVCMCNKSALIRCKRGREKNSATQNFWQNFDACNVKVKNCSRDSGHLLTMILISLYALLYYKA